MRFLKTNTATRVTVGPFLDVTNGVTPEVALTATNEHLTFMVDTGGVPTLVLDTALAASGTVNDFVHVTNDDAGFYDLELAAADVNYVGRAILGINYVTDHCPVFHEFMILSAQAYEAMCGTGNFSADVLALNGQATSAVNLERSASVIHPGTVDTTGNAATTVMLETNTTDLVNIITASDADHFVGRLIVFTSGVVRGQATDITASTLVTGRLRLGYSAVTSAPANGVTFVIV
jgi:hypothetical protein